MYAAAPSQAFGSTPRRATIASCLVVVAIIVAIDVVTRHINLPILYFIPLVMCAKTGRRRALMWLTILLVVLTYSLYFWEHRNDVVSWPHRIVSYRIVNRTLVACGLCVTAAIMGAWSRVHEEWQRRTAQSLEPEQDAAFDQAVRMLKRVIVVMLCTMLSFFIFGTDLIAPRQFNLPILYAVPLIIAAWAESRRVLWVMLPILLACTWIGFLLGPQQTVPVQDAPPNILQSIMANRILATVAQLGIAITLHFWMSPPPPEPRGFSIITHDSAAA